MKILVACEFSGVVRDAFIVAGHTAVSCDLMPSESDLGEHYQGDVLDIIGDGWDMMIAHPPCTYLSVSGARWFYHPDDSDLPVESRRPHPVYPNRSKDREDAVSFFMALADADIDKICIENPVGTMSTTWRKPDQIVQPWMFGHDASKKTCLWLKNLPLLVPTNIIEKDIYGNQTKSGQNKLGPSEKRAMIRSITYSGIADAMATQWGSLS